MLWRRIRRTLSFQKPPQTFAQEWVGKPKPSWLHHIQGTLMVLDNWRLIMHKYYRKEILAKIHIPHHRLSKSLHISRKLYSWPRMKAEIMQMISRSQSCRSHLDKQCLDPPFLEKLTQWRSSTWTFKIREARSILQFKTRPADYSELSSWRTWWWGTWIKSFLNAYGIPKTIKTDGRNNFTGLDFSNYCRDIGIKKTISSAQHSQSNGRVEASVKIVKKLKAKCKDENEDFEATHA